MSRHVDRKRLLALRLERRLTTRELADRAGLAYRTVLELERGRRRSVEEITLLRLADALGCAPEDLEQRPPPAAAPSAPPPARRRHLRLALLALFATALLLPGWVLLRDAGGPLPDLALEDGTLVARHARTRAEAWRFEAAAPVIWQRPTPWGEDLALFALGGEGSDGGRVLLVRRRDGRVLWEFAPDLGAASLAFPDPLREIPHTGVSSYLVWLDFDGDGEQELAAGFNHLKYYPFWISLLDRDGRHLGTYLNRGSIYDPLAVDLDGDGAQEYLTGGTNNSPALQGATFLLLDWACHTGVALDSASGDTVCLPDSARVRLVLPSFGEPWMELLNLVRLESRQPRVVRDEAGEIRIEADVFGDALLTVTLDRDLRPLAAVPTGRLRDLAAGWPAPYTNGGPADPAWLAAWLGRALRFEAGHYRPAPCDSLRPARIARAGSRRSATRRSRA